MPHISIVIPVYDEEKNISLLYSSLKDILKKIKRTHEIIFVDDGSRDQTLGNLIEIKKKDKNVKIIKFRRNFGQSAAMDAGFKLARGSIIIAMDADLQNDPNDIPRLITKIDQGYDVVSGWRYNRKDSFSKRMFSKFANKLYRKLTGIRIHDSGCSLKAYKKQAIGTINLYGEMHRHIPALLCAQGFKIGEIKVKHKKRKFGKTKYGYSRLLKGFLDLLYVYFWIRYSHKPLHFFGKWGIVQIIMGGVIGIFKAINLFIKILIQDQVVFVGPLLLLAVLLIISGTLFILFGFLAEMKIRLFFTQSKKTYYNIEKII